MELGYAALHQKKNRSVWQVVADYLRASGILEG
jgi:hypothetical protein